MDSGRSQLSKAEVEALLAAAAAPADDDRHEIDQVREALRAPLARLCGLPVGAGWVASVDAASVLAGWDRPRWAALRLALRPESLDDPAGTLGALWDLVTELNERRHL